MEYVLPLEGIELEEMAKGIKRAIFYLEKLMCVYLEIDPGVVVKEHTHPHEQMGLLLAGRVKFTINGKTQIIEGKSLYRIPSNVPHEAEISGEEKAVILDIFSPIREDFLSDQRPSYMDP